ncbi:MAG: diphosphomevalonate decarboxylase [Chloroflexota bacterium]
MSLETPRTATARAYSNIAFVKYWGNTDHNLRLPANPSLSMNLNGLYTETAVSWVDHASAHTLNLNDKPIVEGATLDRVASYLDDLKRRYSIDGFASVVSTNNFPIGAGIASSASAFAALALAAVGAANLTLPEDELSTLARLGSGSASRSVPGGFVEWGVGESHETSYARSIAPADHWDLVDVIAIVSEEHKAVGSTRGHTMADTSVLQAARVSSSFERFEICKRAILEKDFASFASVVELDSNIMHAVMMTSQPSLFYWQPASIAVMQAVRQWRAEGLSVCYTLDAGPNVHCICLASDAGAVEQGLRTMPGVTQVLTATPGGPATLLNA